VRPINGPPATPPRDVDLTGPPFTPLRANGPLPVLSNLPSPTSSSFSRPPVKSDLSRRVSVTLYDPPVPKLTPDLDATPSPIPTPPSSARGATAQWSQQRENSPPTPLALAEPATPKSSQTLPYMPNGTRERKTGSNKLQKSTRPVSPPPSSKRESMQVAPKSVDKRLSSLQRVMPTHTPSIRASFDATSTPAKTSMQPPIKPLPTSNSFYGAMPTEIVLPNTQLLSPAPSPPGPPRTQSQPHVETTNRAPAPKRPDTDPVAPPPANLEPLPPRPAVPPSSPQHNASAECIRRIHSPSPGVGCVPGPEPGSVEPEPVHAVDVGPTPSRQSSAHKSAHSVTSASTAPSQVLKTPPDLAQEQEQRKSPPESKSSITMSRTPDCVDGLAADVDMAVESGPAVKTKRKDGHSHRDSQSSHEHEHRSRHGKAKETGEEDGLAISPSKDNSVIQVLVKRREKSRKEDVSDAPVPTVNADPPTPATQPPATQRSPSPQPPSQQPPTQNPPKSTPTPSPAPFRAPPSAARTLLPMHMPSRRRQASSPISKGEVEAARALGVVLFYPLEKHVNDPGLLEELLAYLSFQEFMTLSSTSKRIRTMLEDRKDLRETVLERFLVTVGYRRWGFEVKEPLELTLKVCVRPLVREGFFLRQNIIFSRRISIPTSGACPSRSTDMLKSPRRRRQTIPPAGQRAGLFACSRPPRARTPALSSACVRKLRRRQQ
jgi:hypothetical protein